MLRLSTFLFCLSTLTLSAQRYDFEVYNMEDGLPVSGVYDLLEGRDGTLWIATEGGGLSTFDGDEFAVVDSSSGIPARDIRCLFEDSKGRIYAGSERFGLSIFNGSSWSLFSGDAGLRSNHVRCITEDSTGTIWLGMLNGGIQQLRDDSLLDLNSMSAFNKSSMRCALTDTKGRVWIGGDAGLFCFENDSLTHITKADSLPNDQVLCLYEDKHAQIWVGTLEGAAVIQDKQVVETPEELAGVRIRSISSDALGNFWFGTKDGCLLLNEKAEYNRISERNGLSNSRIRKIYRDPSNSIWIGTYFGGICKLNQLSTIYYDARSGYTDNNITALAKDSSGNYWFGSFEGQVYQLESNELRTIYRSGAYNDNHINVLSSYLDGVLIGSSEDGLVYASPKRKQLKLGLKKVIDISTKADTAWIIGDGRIYFMDASLALKSLNVKDIGALQSICNLENELLIGTDNGFYKMSTARDAQPILVPCKEDLNVSCMANDAMGNVWIGTDGQGMWRYNGKKLKKYSSSRYLNSKYIRFITVDDDQNLWLGTAKGITQIELDPGQEIVLNHRELDETEGFNQVVTNRGAAMADHDGSMWFGTIHGLLKYQQGKNFPDPSEPPLSLKAIQLNDQEVRWDTLGLETNKWGIPENPEFDYQMNHLTFNFRAQEPSAQEKVVYQYKLDGFEENWSGISMDREVTYKKLPPGEYTFLLRARNRDGLWNEEPLSYHFTILTPLHEQPWFIALIILIGSLIIYGVVRVRINLLKRQNLILEGRVSERTRELQEEQKKSESLLLNILPLRTAEELKEKGKARARKYESASVLFSDFKGFTTLTEQLDSEELVESLDECFKAFDKHTEKYKVEKIKTIGDAYMCATGIPDEDPKHALHLVQFAFKMLEEVEKMNKRRRERGKHEWPIRIGIHSGPVVTGVVGDKKFAYDIWGDTVNTAARMESSGAPGKINISLATRELLADKGKFIDRGLQEAKNKGELEMYFVDYIEDKNESIHEKG